MSKAKNYVIFKIFIDSLHFRDSNDDRITARRQAPRTGITTSSCRSNAKQKSYKLQTTYNRIRQTTRKRYKSNKIGLRYAPHKRSSVDKSNGLYQYALTTRGILRSVHSYTDTHKRVFTSYSIHARRHCL